MSGNFQQEVFELISKMTGEKNILAIPKIFLKATGSLQTGVFLSQLIYWSDKGNRDDGYIYKTHAEWEKEIFLSKYEINKARAELERLGLLETKVKKANGNPTVHYKLLQKPLIDWLVKFLKNESESLEKQKSNFLLSLTEITAETTTKNHHHDRRRDAHALEEEPSKKDFMSSIKELITRYVDNFTWIRRDIDYCAAFEYYIEKYKARTGLFHPKIDPDIVFAFITQISLLKSPDDIYRIIDGFFSNEKYSYKSLNWFVGKYREVREAI